MSAIHPTMERLYRAASEIKKITSPSRVARLLNSSPQTLKNWESRGISQAGANNAQAAIGCNANWLLSGEGPMSVVPAQLEFTSNVIAIHPEDDLPEDIVQIPEYTVRFSGGNGSTVIEYELSEEREPATYRRTWMQRLHLNPEKLMRFKVKGDSMEPLLFAGDSVLVNLAENDITQLVEGKVYAIRYGSELRVKRLYPKLDGSLILRSDNKDYTDEFVPPDLVHQHITIIGRVRDKSGAGGL